MIKVVDYNPKHYQEIKPREQDAKAIEAINFESYLKDIVVYNLGEVRTILDKEGVITIMVMRKLHDGVAEVFQIPNNKRLVTNVKKAARIIISEQERIFKKGFWKLSSYCKDDKLHNRWMRFLGYEKEGLLKKHSYDKTDLVLWGMVR